MHGLVQAIHQRLDVFRLFLDDVAVERHHVDDHAGGGRAVHQHLALLLLAHQREVRLPGHGGGHAAGDEGGGGVVGGHVLHVDVVHRHAGVLEQVGQPELRHGAFVDRDFLALQLGQGVDLLAHQHAVAAMAVVQRGDRLEAEARAVLEDFVDGGSGALDLTGGLRGHVHRRFLDSGEFQVEALFLEVAQVAGEVQGAIADPGGMADGQGAGLRTGGGGSGKNGERKGTGKARKGLDHEALPQPLGLLLDYCGSGQKAGGSSHRNVRGSGLCGPWPVGGGARHVVEAMLAEARGAENY
ncbi:hypothetical protein D3C78_895240 [compost metagenome]